MPTDYRNIDGSGNNLTNPEYGKAGENFIRKTPSDYGDGISSMAGDGRPNPRDISNELFSQEGDIYNAKLASNFMWSWGQFIDHDIDLTREGHEFSPIDIPNGDPYFDPFYSGSAQMPFNRSGYDADTGTTTPREQVNDITSFIDASNVYGSSTERAEWLRADGGKLKLSEDGFLPYNDGTQDNAGGPATNLFLAGDVRANENVALTSLQTTFVREHNRLVDELSEKHPGWDADMLYSEAKMIVEAELQAITYNEYLPMLLGENALQDYTGYDDGVNAAISNVFAGAAFRLGHTQLSPTIARTDEWGNEAEHGDLALRDAFFSPDKMAYDTGPDDIFRGLAETYAQNIDLHLIDDVRNFLFGPPGAGGLDLGALNIHRGRDHGLPDYNTARESFGLDKVISFAEITSNVEVQQKLENLYGSVDDIDIFVGGLAEDHVDGSMMGELLQTILVDQFTRLRDGDRYFFENRLNEETLEYVNSSTLSEIIQRNTDIEHLQSNLFEAYDRVGGTDLHDDLEGSDYNDLIIAQKGNDEVFGNDGKDDLYGGEGHDWLDGGKGDDHLYGEQGHDELVGGTGNDELYGGQGHDWLDGGKGNDHLEGGLGHDELEGGEGHDYLDGGKGHDELWGGSDNDYIDGGKGMDELFGGNGNDHLVGSTGHDYLEGNKGNDHLEGGKGHDELFGGKGNDYLEGGKGYDILEGGQGNDTLKGGWDDDDLWGGLGADTFVFDIQMGVDKLIHLVSNDNDTIHDFNAHEGDKIEFHGVEDFNDDGKTDWNDVFDNADVYNDGDHTTIDFHGGGSIDIHGTINPDEDTTVIT